MPSSKLRAGCGKLALSRRLGGYNKEGLRLGGDAMEMDKFVAREDDACERDECRVGESDGKLALLGELGGCKEEVRELE